MTDTVLERLLRRDRWVVGACLAVIAALAWGWLISMGAMDMGAMPMAPTYATQLGAAFVMWLVMMVAMMLPSAAPMILLYARFSRQARRQGAVPTPVAALAGGLLIAAGLYQLTPLKRTCLERCRSPVAFITRLWRPGWAGAVRLGAVHGLYCLGCCWLIMALLFVGGVMNLAWVGMLALLVLVEKVAPFGRQVGIALGVIAMGMGAALLFAPWL